MDFQDNTFKSVFWMIKNIQLIIHYDLSIALQIKYYNVIINILLITQMYYTTTNFELSKYRSKNTIFEHFKRNS